MIRHKTLHTDQHLDLNVDDLVTELKLYHLQQRFQLDYGHFNEEVPEQFLAVRYIKPNHTVLELGGNIGRNSCIISGLLDDESRLVVVESSPSIGRQLVANRDRNKLKFHIENAAISVRPLVQNHWITKAPGPDTTGKAWVPIPTITYKDLRNKYRLKFDALVVDCEGAFPQIVKDEPEILDNIKLVILENNGGDINFLCTELERRDFVRVYNLSLGPRKDFYQVWKWIPT